jgi:hypothetical protein
MGAIETHQEVGLNCLSEHRLTVIHKRRAPGDEKRSPQHVRVWHALATQLQDADVEAFIRNSASAIEADARLHRIDPRCLETQIRLHVPRLARAALTAWPATQTYLQIRDAALDRSVAMREARMDAERQAWSSSLLLGREVLRRDLSITRVDGFRYPLRFSRVPSAIGYFYQKKLHYLRHARTDTTLEFGLFLHDAPYPISYLAFSPCDRSYMVDALDSTGVNAERSDVLVLTRAYGLPNVPPGTLSLTISRAIRAIKASTNYRFVITAFNPMLGFRGTAFLASGFVPFATAPVTYAYDRLGYFATRRQGVIARQQLDTPNNIISVLSLDKRARRTLTSVNSSIKDVSHFAYGTRESTISIDDIVSSGKEWTEQLKNYRLHLQQGWSVETLHPAYRAEPAGGPPSRGQCGVSSVWLARKLRDVGLEATYCYGRMSFEDPAAVAVDHHCWLEIGDVNDDGRLVIDVTSDQALGLDRPVLCEPHHELKRQGIHYEAGSRLTFDQLEDDRVWDRFMKLKEKLEPLNSEDLLPDAHRPPAHQHPIAVAGD